MRSFLYLFVAALCSVFLPSATSNAQTPRPPQGIQPTQGTTQTTTTQATTLQAQNFGVVGDGVTDDGPAVLKMLAAAAQATGPVTMQFAPNKSYFLKSGRNRYAFYLDGARDVTLEGGNSLFLIDAEQRFLKIINSRNVVVRGFKVDYVPLPFADGTVIAKNTVKGTLDVQIDAGQVLPPTGGATHGDGEQAYLGSLWAPGTYSAQGTGGAYWVRNSLEVLNVSTPSPDRVVRVRSQPGNRIMDAVKLGQWRFSVPVRSAAHLIGPGETCALRENANLTLENLEIWSAPWVAFGINGNRGRVVLRHVNVRPKLGTTRTASVWHEAFRVKNNRANLVWEDCTVQGNGEDAFNISSQTSTVRQVVTENRIKISQNSPSDVTPMETGDTLVFYNPSRGAVVARAKIARVDPANYRGEEAPLFTLDLAEPLVGLEGGKTLVWNESSGNPNNYLLRCRVDTSCRFRSAVTLDTCQINALTRFTGDKTESPLPRNVKVLNSQFRAGQGDVSQVISMGGMYLENHGPTQPVIFNVLFDRNRVWGDILLNDIKGLVLTDNNFLDAKRDIVMSNVEDVILRGNLHGGLRIEDVGDLAGHALYEQDQVVGRALSRF